MNEAKLRSIVNEEVNKELASFFGQMMERFDELERKLDTKADRDEMNARFDSIIASIEEDRAERAALEHQVKRHERYLQKFPGV